MTNLFLPQATFGISLRTSSAFWGNRENLREDCTRRRRECASLAIIEELARRLANFQGLIIPRGQTDTLLRWIDQERLGERLTWTRQLADYILRRSRIPCALSSNFFFFFSVLFFIMPVLLFTFTLVACLLKCEIKTSYWRLSSVSFTFFLMHHLRGYRLKGEARVEEIHCCCFWKAGN